nr:hypothetical protein CFP56_64009 [Quercus suber]
MWAKAGEVTAGLGFGVTLPAECKETKDYREAIGSVDTQPAYSGRNLDCQGGSTPADHREAQSSRLRSAVWLK